MNISQFNAESVAVLADCLRLQDADILKTFKQK